MTPCWSKAPSTVSGRRRRVPSAIAWCRPWRFAPRAGRRALRVPSRAERGAREACDGEPPSPMLRAGWSGACRGRRRGLPAEAVISPLPSRKWQDVSLVRGLKGAHIGDQGGIGAVYSANLIGASQTATKVRFAVIAASRNGVIVVIFAVDPADPKNSPNGIPEGQAFDYLCTEFSWT